MTKLRYTVAMSALMAALLINVAALHTDTNAQAAMNRAGLVVQFKDGSVQTRCVSFSEPEISGYDLLRRAKLSVVADVAGGGSICKIGDTGCNFPGQPCFCECQDLNQTCIYWMYYFQADGAWKYSPLGAGIQKVTNGGVNGWVYGAGSASSGGTMPPLLTFEQICAETQAQPTIAPTTAPQPTAPPVPTSEPTVAPTASTAPPATATPSLSRTAPAATMTIAPQASAITALTATATPEVVAAAQATPTSATSAATDTATAVPSVTAASTTPAPDIATASSAPPTASAVPTAEEAAGQTTSNNTSYLFFGGIVVALAAVLLLMRRGSGGAKPR
jgi:hypothetical protein